jgi:hypothetical protein
VHGEVSARLAVDEQLEHQKELWQQCIAASRASQGNSEHSEDSDSMPVPDPDDSGGVKVVTGHGLRVANDEPTWTVPSISMPLQRVLNSQIPQPIPAPDWMTPADWKIVEYMPDVELVLWKQFGENPVEPGEDSHALPSH